MDNKKMIDVVIDTDAYNEIDDQFAIAYLLKNSDRLNTVALYAAPFFNSRSISAEDGMVKSFFELKKIVELSSRGDLLNKIFKGSTNYLPDENTPVFSAAANDLASRALAYTPENPLYVVAIGAITNVASAVLMNPEIADRIKLVWLGGHATWFKDTKEFNMIQDVAAARVVMSKVTDFVLLPCCGVVSQFTASKQELEYFLVGKNPLADYLAVNAIKEADSYAAGRDWTRVIWDVTAVGYLLNDDDRFMLSKKQPVYLPNYDGYYEKTPINKTMDCVYYIHRDTLMNDLFKSVLS